MLCAEPASPLQSHPLYLLSRGPAEGLGWKKPPAVMMVSERPLQGQDRVLLCHRRNGGMLLPLSTDCEPAAPGLEG